MVYNVNALRVFYKTNFWLLLVPCVLGGLWVYATVDTTVYTTTELVVIPGIVETTDWKGLDSVLIQDVGEYALHQDFNIQNSASPERLVSSPALPEINDNEPALPEGETTGEARGDELPAATSGDGGGGDTSSQVPVVSPDSEGGAGPSPDNEEFTDVVSEESAAEESTPEPEPASKPEASDESSTTAEPQARSTRAAEIVWGVFSEARERYPLAQEVEDTPQETVEVTEEDSPSDEATEESALLEETQETEVEPVETLAPGADSLPDPESDDELLEEGSGNEESLPTTSEGVDEQDVTSPDLGTEVDGETAQLGNGDDVASTLVPCEASADCSAYALSFSGFTLPEFDSASVLDAAQLRLSLSAKERAGQSYEGPQRFRVEYRYGSSSDYALASVIEVDDEVSNSLNGGYYLIGFGTPPTLAELSALQVRVVYEGNLEAMEAVYLESIWLEVTAGSFYEDRTLASTTDAITYERSLEAPKFHELYNPDIDATFSSLPSFTLRYDPQEGFLRRVFTALFSENVYRVERVRLTDSEGEVVDIAIDTVYHDDTTWTLQFREQPQKLRSGKYRFEVVVGENDTEYIDHFEFYWGVLAVNPTKSMYTPGEEVHLHMAALTDKGDTICDASLTLKIIDPEQAVTEVPIERTGACGKNNVTDIPDYVAHYTDTNSEGRYVLQLSHYNQGGELVHLIEDSFEVRPFVAFDIERTAPTRIYPLAPYDVSIAITANHSFAGDIVETVPRGFVIVDAGGANVISKPEVTELVWSDVTLSEGDSRTLSYRFDAPDISPYTYLLGPLDMDGFRELRHWQIASDALSGVGWFTATRTVNSTNLNNALSPLQWSTSTVDAYYYTHSTSSNSHQVTLRQAGDYLLAVNVPMIRTDGTNSRSRVGVEVRVNGVAVPEGLGRSGYIRNANSHSESSSHVNFLLSDVAADDLLEVYVGGVSVIETTDIVNPSGVASMFLEYVGDTKTVFSATTTRTTNSTNLNQSTAYALQWTETRQDTGYVHSDSVNPENITLSDSGTYLVHISIPLTNSTADHQAVLGRVRLGGVQVPGGVFAQGYARPLEDTDSDDESSIHWTGVVTATTSNQVLTVTTESEGAAGTTTVTTGFVGSIYIEKLATTDTLVLRGTTLSSGSDWSPAAATAINFNNQVIIDNSTYTHSTTTNSQNIVVDEAGSYLLTFNAPFNVATQHTNTRVTVTVNGVERTGAQTKPNYIRNQGGHTNSSGQLVFLLEDVAASATINVRVQEEAANATLALTSDVIVTLTQKIQNNERPTAPTTFNTPFSNIRFASTTPYFDFEAVDPDGTSDLTYEFQIGTSSDFVGAITRYSTSSTGFSNTASTTDTSPFREDDMIRFQLQPADALTDLATYYWRVRARDVTGSGEYGDWSVTQNLTVNMAYATPNWYQSLTGQFDGNSFVGTVSSGNDNVQVDAAINDDIMAVYAEGTVATPRFRIWNGTSWGVEGNAVAVSNTINWVETAAGVSRDEYVLVTLDQSNDAYAQVYSASTSAWGSQVVLSDVVVSSVYRGVAVAYESVSGDAMAISCTNSPDPVFRIWNGTSWSATSTLDVSSLNNCNYIQVASDPVSDEIIVVVRDTGTQYEAWVWDGSTWIANRIIGVPAAVAVEGMAVAYESSGNQALITVSNGTAASFLYTTWNGLEFSTNVPQSIGNDFMFANLESDPASDALVLCYVDADTDIGVLRWDGGVWSTSFQELTGTGNANTARPVDCTFETFAGRSGYAIAPYSDTGVDGDYHATSPTSTWTTNLSGSNINDALWVQSERAGDGLVMTFHYDDENDRIDATYWNGSSWSTSETLEAALPAAGVYEAMSLSAKRFQFTQGSVQTPPISFSFVPNQPRWGDITFSTTEPFGTDVKVRVRYTATTTCDSYIPNGALSGNGSGFDVTQSPIDLTGLSTTTYGQICLEATLTIQGSASAGLDEWTLSWVREPRLVQNNYRWYVNGSFLTPTDPWPSGITDLALNTPLDSTVALSVDEAIRLRISLQGLNVALPTSTERFKLQYAEGLTCSPSLSWADVGSPASTTALFRGVENSIVGSDWYSAAWPRRVKITVDDSVVEDDVTNFPVYLDLSVLPAAFFDSVQSDGDDIRITTSDGVTELPYELVSINTGTDTGELHFKATMGSTTDSEFYIYYGNGSASGYAASATYGAQNVWTNSYSMRHALDDNPTTASPQFRDSTSNSNDAVAYSGMTAGDVVAGKIGSAIDLDGNDGGTFETALAFAGQFTASMWWRASTTGGGDGNGFAIAGPAGANEKMGPWNTPEGTVFVRTSTASSDNTATHPADRTWTYVVLTRDSSNVVRLFLNGTTTTLYGGAAQTGTSDWINFGGETTQGFEGQLDELRFATTRRSAGWISTEYNNQSNPQGFFSVSAEELIGDGRRLPSTVLTGSDYRDTYEEENPTQLNQNQIEVGSDAEWDFVLENHAALPNTNYCFRLVYDDGATFNTYTNYPRLITNSPPLTPIVSAPFDNERLASTTPWFDFAADDELEDLVSYEIEIDDSADFSSPVVARNSVDHFALFTNIASPSERSQYTSGQTIRFIPATALSNNTTYWWRVRGRDDFGSNTFGPWSTPQSVTVATGTTITTWFQTTGEQFLTNELADGSVSTSTNDVGIASGFTIATITSTVIDYDDRDTGNAWGELSWTDNESSGVIDYYVEYNTGGGVYALVPDSALPGNSSGFNTSPISLIGLNTTTYNELRIRAVLSGNSTLPRLLDWTVTWGLTIEAPIRVRPFDNEKVATTTPAFTFYTSDPQAQDLQYELQLSSSNSFTSSTTFLSGVDAGFTNTASSTDTSPYLSGNTIRYRAQSPLTNGLTYWWRVRARDPGGSNTWSEYSEPQSFTIDTALSVSAWFQTTGEQFLTGDTADVEATAGAAQITSTISEVLMAYGEGTGQAPRYRIWDGTAWGSAGTAESVGAQVRYTRLKASPTRPEYALGTTGTDNDVNVQIYNSDSDTWGNVLELHNNVVDPEKRAFDLAYETDSGDLLAVSCFGTDAVSAIWNGTSWSATSSINLVNTNNCEWVLMASDPTSDEIIAVFRHTVAAGVDYEARVWNGSSWTSTTTLGDLVENASEGMALAYEESGNQAVLVMSTSSVTQATALYFTTWNGSAWSTPTSSDLGDHIEFATLRADVGTDRLALCYNDNDNDGGFKLWDGSAWQSSFTEVEPADVNDRTGRPVDCAFETTAGLDGDLIVAYSDTLNVFYRVHNSSTSAEFAVTTLTDSFELEMVRGGNGTLHLSAYDDAAATGDDINATYRNGGSWNSPTSITLNSSLDGNTPYIGGSSMAAQIYPNFVSGSIRSTAIDFNDGDGPRWESVSWNDTTPGASTIEYRVYYLASTSQYALIPDSALPGNSAGFTTSPIDISALDRTVYEVLKLDAQFICDAGDCPTLNDWTVAWAEGITVSGVAREFDGIATTTSGTVAVAVNGELQVGKTGSITASGTWSIANVTAFAGDALTVWVDGATDANEAVAVTTYDGIGNASNLELTKRHLTIGSDDSATTTNAGFAGYDNADDEDIFFTVGVGNALVVCAEAVCADGRLKIRSGAIYQPDAAVTTHDFSNFGTFRPASTTVRVSGSWSQQGSFVEDTSTIIFTATSGAESITATGTTAQFYNLSIGESGSSTGTHNLTQALSVLNTLNIANGTLSRGTSSISISGNFTIGVGGNMSGLGTTTFTGSGSHTWSDAKATSTNVGYAVIDGTAKTITLGGSVAAQSVTIGSDDTFNASGSGYNITVYGGWINNNSFIPQSGTVTFAGTSSAVIARGTSAFNNLTFNGAGGSWSFSTSTLVLNGSLTIATGTVTLPTGTTTIAGSFTNSGGTFLHNNGEVRMTSTVAGRTILQNGTVFNNAFYDLVFTGSGSWTYSGTGTTSRHMRITAGTVTFPGSTLTVGGDLLTSGSGAFAHNNGEVILLVQDSNSVTTNGSSFNHVRTRGAASGSWYNDAWDYRIPITIQEAQIDGDLSNFPVYLNLDDLPSGFWSAVQGDGDDLRVTQSDGVTEVPIELVSINTGTTDGEFYFRATTLSSTTNSTYYLYYGNGSASAYASTSAFGARNVWSSNYRVVAHSGDLTTATILNSAMATSGTKTSAGNPAVTTSGRVGSAQDFSTDSVQFAGNVVENQNQYSVSMWFNADALTGGNADEQSFGRSLYGISASGAPYQWLRVGGTANPDELTLCAYTNSTTCNVSTGADVVTGTWYHVSVNAVDAGATTLRVNGVERLSFTNPGDGTVSANFTLSDLRPTRGINWDGRIDEVRVANVTRSNAWRDAEYRNIATTSTFYSVGAAEASRARNFSDATVTMLGNFVLESGGDALLPAGTLSVGGSFDNDATFDARGGTVRFNSTAGAETIAAGTTSPFATLEFNSATGDFTLTENATATVAVNLTNAAQFTLQSSRALTALGTFTNAASGTITTWTGSLLVLGSGSSTTLNAKTHGGDSYGTLRAASSTLVRMWNSQATTYQTEGATGAIYSQDHAAVDGDLYIYGNYARTTGTEHWSYATDFDGTALGTSTSRQVDVRIASSSSVVVATSTLSVVGVATASTTVAAQSGAYTLRASLATVTAQYFSVSDTDNSGLQLTASTTLATFTDGAFTVTPLRTGISVDGATVNRNASGQFFRISFSTTTPGLASNVTLTSSSSNFIWFRQGSGNLYGEAFDAGDDNPGSLRFDDSSYLITVSGTVYSDDGTTTMGAPVCNGTTPNVRIIVDGGSYASSTPCNASTGAYSFPSVAYVGDPKVVVFLDLGSTTQRAATFSKTLTTNVTNMHIYGNRLIVRHEDTAALTITDLANYDNDNEADLPYIATTGATNTLTVLPLTELYVWNGKTFAPGGNVTLAGNGNSNGYEGTLQLGANAAFTATGTETHTLAGRLVLGSLATITPASSTIVFNATTSGKSITGTSTIAFNRLQFNGVGGTWNIGANLLVYENMYIDNGIVTGTGSLTLPWGSLLGNGTLSLGGGTVHLYRTNTLGGTSPWTFNNLTLGNGSVVGTTSPAGTATTTIAGVLTISGAHFLDSNDSRWDLSGTGTVLVESGTFLEDTSTLRYSGAGANVTATDYYNLVVNAGVAAPTFTALSGGIVVRGDLQVGGATTTTFTLTANDPLFEVRGNVYVASNGTLVGSNSALLTVLGSWDNDGVFTSSGGSVRFAGTGSTTIAAGQSSFGSLDVNGTGAFTFTESATTTGALTLTNHSSFTVASGQTLAVGAQFTNVLAGAATTWTGATLHLFGSGTFEINASTTSDTYNVLSVAAGTQVRMWNSSAASYAVNSTGSLYSMDHAGNDGDLYIYGQLVRASGTDHWSYATDFDGTALTTGRGVDVYFASGASARFTAGGLSVIGSSTASTTLQNQGSGTYAMVVEGTASTSWDRVVIRDVNASGIVFSGTPTVVDFSRTDHLVKINSGTALTIGGTVINQNPAKNFASNIFEADTGVTGATNVTATGTATAAWRFTGHSGDIAGEGYDVDPDGDPGYVVWDDSAALITVSGNVYSDEGSTVSSVCDGVATVVRLVVAGLTNYNATCSPATGAFSIPNVAYNTNDTLTLFLNGTTPKAATVSIDPISSIANLHLYERRVVVRHEGTDPITIDDMAVYDSSDDADIPFTAVSGAPDTLSISADRKLIVWTGKTFAPGGNVTVLGGGSGDAVDGTFEAQTNATFRTSGSEAHSIGGSFTFATGASFVPAQSTITFTTSGAVRTIDINAGSFYNTTFSGSGSWTVTDPTLTLGGTFAQSAGIVTFPTGTTTIGRAFNVTGGTFAVNGSPLSFIATTTGQTVRFGNSAVAALTFSGVGGGWNMTDTHATASRSITVTAGTLSLPSGNLAVGGSFENRGGTIAHNTADLIMTSTSSAVLRASSSDLYAVRFVGVGPFTLADQSVTFLDDFAVNAGSVTIGTGTLAVGGSFTATGGTFSHASGTVLLNASAGGKTVDPGSSSFYNLQIGAPSGGYTMGSATTTNNFTIASVNSLTVSSGARVRVGGVFTNSVGGAATTWTGSTLILESGTAFSVNSRTNSGDVYGTLQIGANTDVRTWYSSAATTSVAASGSLYAQDHNNVNGHLYIWGDVVIATTTEYWSYATDFDGTTLTGSERAVSVYMAPTATTTLSSGALELVGASGNVTSVQSQSASTTYALRVLGGTLNASYYSMSDVGVGGLLLSGTPTITDLSNGYFNLAVNSEPLITLSSTTLNANPSKIFDNVGFNASSPLTGNNIELVGETPNAWRFTNSYGNLGGEANDIDGVDACGSLRFDDSQCLLTEQTHVRWRLDDGGEGAPTSEWFDLDWDYRKRIRLVSDIATSTATTAVKVTITYDSDMQSDFDDLRFTAADGTTLLSHWVERATASVSAVVWVRVPSVVPDTTTVFMYYGNTTASTTSSGTSTLSAIDDFEDNNLTEYSGDTSLFQTDSSPVYGGSYALEPSNTLGRTIADGIYRTDLSVSQGQAVRWMQYVNVSAPEDDACTFFGVQSPGSNNQNYAVCLQRFGPDRLILAKNVTDNDSSGTVLSTTSVTYATGWYEVEVDWQTDDSMDVALYTESGTLVATTSATDSSYTTGGIGFGFWINKGAWDSVMARTGGAGRPQVYFGAEQVPGGASWAADLDEPGSAYEPGSVARLRVAIENSGLDITNQQFRLEYAAKGAAPTCESVSASNFVTVPIQASCGSSPICMATSSYVADGDVLSDQLFGTNGTYVSGQLVENPSVQTSAIDIDQSFYTELEYVLTPTINASDSYCFRVTNAGTELDFYAKVAELGLQFDPTISSISFNGGAAITLTPGTTTAVVATTSVFDFNGGADLEHATATFYRTSVGASCTVDNNNCYRLSTETGGCSFSSCSGNSCQLTCTAHVYFHADPTDFGTYDGQEWFAFIEAEDQGGGYGFNSSPGIELATLRAISVDALINYGALEPTTDTGGVNSTTTVRNLGNVALDVEVEGTDLSDGQSSIIPVTQQKFSTSTFTYTGCVSCAQLSSSTPVAAGLNLSKPANITPPVAADVFWGIAVPFGINSAPHSGTNIFTPVDP